MEFLSKAGCEPDPIFVKAEADEEQGWIRLLRTERPTPSCKRSGAEAAALITD